MNKRRKGLSLIVLVITILVMLILSGVVIVSLSKNNPIEKAKEAVAATDIASYRDELNLNIVNKLTEDPSITKESINARSVEEIKKYIPSLKKEHENNFIISHGELEVAPNKPILDVGMIPIKYNGTNWQICTIEDPEWYDYANKKWANVMLSDGTYKDKNLVGQVVKDSELGSMFVWIPRYAYSINEYKTNKYESDIEGKEQQIHDISFLLGTSNTDVTGKSYAKTYTAPKVGEKTTPIVHPAFTFGKEELTGFWSAKFEASMNEEGTGHTNSNSNASCNFTDNNHSMIKVLPNKNIWRYITVGNCFFNSANMNKPNNIYGLKNTDSHLIKNSEWGAVTCLTTSKYGFTPTINDNVNYYSGGGDYKVNVKQSTTGNITGIYDMNGGSWEYVAAYYANNNNILSLSGGSATLFKDNVLNPSYTKYFDKYEVGDFEKDTKNHAIWDAGLEKNQVRLDMTKARFKLMANHFGDEMYEATKEDNYSYWGKKTDNRYDWVKTLEPVNEVYGRTVYNNDIALIGNIKYSFLSRGGYFANSYGGGIFAYYNNEGSSTNTRAFRPTLVITK